uniref:antirestriction protein n=1 Tax=Ferrimonas kyonanensis TaxID=364763 RepID=UPI000480647E
FFLAPATQEPLALEWRGNYSSEQVSAEAAGIVITLFALGHLSCNFPHYPKIAERYHQLRDYVGGHNEAAKIWRLID